MEIDEYFHIYFHSFTIYVLDEKDIECEISFRIKHFLEAPGWRNWQTQRTQNPPVLGTLGVRLPLPAPLIPFCFERSRSVRSTFASAAFPVEDPSL